MSAGWSLRPARSSDLARVADHEVDLFAADAWSADSLEAELRAGRRALLVAEAEAGVVGYAVLAVGDHPDDPAELLRIGVAASQRRQGLASALLDRVLAAAGAAGAQRMLLEVSETNAGAREFYGASGFVEIHRRPRYYRDGAAALILSREC